VSLSASFTNRSEREITRKLWAALRVWEALEEIELYSCVVSLQVGRHSAQLLVVCRRHQSTRARDCRKLRTTLLQFFSPPL
jgi:hypothetical protein